MPVEPLICFGEDSPEDSYVFLLRRGVVTTALYMGSSSQGGPNEYDEAFFQPLEALAAADGLCVTRAWDNYTGWVAPMLVLAQPNGKPFPYPPPPGKRNNRAWEAYHEAVAKAISNGSKYPPQPRDIEWQNPEYLAWLKRIERRLGARLKPARERHHMSR